MTGLTSRSLARVSELARLYGLLPSYQCALTGRTVESPAEAVLAAARVLGAPIDGPCDVAAAIRERRAALWRRAMDPVVVCWDGAPPRIDLRLPASADLTRTRVRIRLEDGEVRRWTLDLSRGPAGAAARVDGAPYRVRFMDLPGRIPHGYHQLRLSAGAVRCEATVLSAPTRAWQPPEEDGDRFWGVFLPLYAARSRRDWGAGSYTDLERLHRWVGRRGGQVVATLPLLASFLDVPFSPSPYSPASRLFWNEFFLDIARIPDFGTCGPARRIASSTSARSALRALRSGDLVDYKAGMEIRRRVLATLARWFFAQPRPDREAFEEFRRLRPAIDDYAAFRAAGERIGSPWPAWTGVRRDGKLSRSDYDPAARDEHLYMQWRAHQQIEGFSRRARDGGRGLYLDFPLGVHPDSYDVWRHRSCFAMGASGGAPPDSFFTRGQDWGFPPLHPERVREDGYRYVAECIRHHAAQAGILRIDHVMGLHRLYWVPHGMKATDGVYVRYRPEELYAVLSLESHRGRTLLVGEDLGTVPPEVRPAMARHGVHRLYVLQFELTSDKREAMRPVPPDSLASINTHDMAPFAGFWAGRDIEERMALGLLGEEGGRRERIDRAKLRQNVVSWLRRRRLILAARPTPGQVLRALLVVLARSRAGGVIVNMEDLWLETEPQNTPGTCDERPNWRRRAGSTPDDWSRMRSVVSVLRDIDRARREGSGS